MKKFTVALMLLSVTLFMHAQKVSLKYNFKEGAKFVANQTSVQKIHQDVMGNSMDITVTVVAKTSYAVLKTDKEQTTLEMTYEALAMKMESPMMNMEYDSNGTVDANNPMHTAFGAIVGKKFLMVMDNRGKIASVTGFEQVMTDLVSRFNGNKEMADQIAASVKQQFSDEALKGSMEMMTAIFPENPVAVGESWVVKTVLRTGMELNSENTLTLKSAADGKWVISGISKLATNSEATVQTQGMDSHFSLTGSAQYEMVLDAATGWLVENSINQTIDGKVSLEGGQLPSAMEIPMKIESQTKMTNI